MRRLNRFALLTALGFLAAGGQSAFGQTLSSMRVGLSVEGAQFIVDGQMYNHTQNFVWPEGSTHIVQFPTASDDGFQYWADGRARYRFGRWVPKFTPPLTGNAFDGKVATIVASPGFLELIGEVEIEHPLLITFQRELTDNYCSDHIAAEDAAMNPDLYGVMFLDGPLPGGLTRCFDKSAFIWVSAGLYQVRIYPFPGYAFTGMKFGNAIQQTALNFTFRIDNKTEIGPIFEPAKRYRFSTNPPGLSLLVDRAPVTPAFTYFPDWNVLFPAMNSSGSCAMFNTLPVGTPLNVPRLCVGDFDFKVGSIHTIGAEPVQTDKDAQYWVFDSFSNGMGQNATLVAGSDTSQMDQIQAKFVRGVRSLILSNVNGLKIDVDGRNNWPGPVYGFVWGEGHTHRISAPETQRDSKGRMWKFIRWSDDGDREHDVTVPIGADGFTVTGYFELLGQVQVTSTPPGLSLKVNGGDCVTPCTVDQPAGETVSLEAPQKLTFGEFSRYEFDSWIGGVKENSQQATFTQDVQVFNAKYFGSHQIVASTDPDNAATFKFSPESPDGFYAEGTQVEVKLTPKTGFKFIKWSQDLSSKSMQDWLTVLGPTNIVAHMEKVPEIAPAGVRNAAGDTPDNSVAPGSIIAIYGEDLATDLLIGPTNPLAQAIGDTYVTVDDRLLPLLFVSPKQINAQLLSSVTEGEHTLVVHTSGKPEIKSKFTVKRNAPGVFFNVTETGMPLVAALHEDGTPVTETSPARRGETISFYGTGLGGYDLPTIDGFILPNTFTYKLLDPVKVLAGQPQPQTPEEANAAETQTPPAVRDPAFAGGAAGMVGTSLIKLTVDPDLPAGNVLEISVSVNGAESNKVQLPVQ